MLEYIKRKLAVTLHSWAIRITPSSIDLAQHVQLVQSNTNANEVYVNFKGIYTIELNSLLNYLLLGITDNEKPGVTKTTPEEREDLFIQNTLLPALVKNAGEGYESLVKSLIESNQVDAANVSKVIKVLNLSKPQSLNDMLALISTTVGKDATMCADIASLEEYFLALLYYIRGPKKNPVPYKPVHIGELLGPKPRSPVLH